MRWTGLFIGVALSGFAGAATIAQDGRGSIPTCPGDPRCPELSDGGGVNVVAGSAADFASQNVTDVVTFAPDSADLDNAARAILAAQAQFLLHFPNARVTVEGHDDDRHSRDAALKLGMRRATAVKDQLVAAGVAPNRIATVSYGKERPVTIGDDDASRMQNRRAVTVIN